MTRRLRDLILSLLVEGSDFIPLLCSHDTTPPVLQLRGLQGCESVGASLQEATEMLQGLEPSALGTRWESWGCSS